MPAEIKHVLVVEDNVALRGVIRFNLEKAGLKVTAARNGLEAWAHLQRGRFDLLVTDLQMPEMSGSELCQRMRTVERFADMPIIMLTAKGWELEADRLRTELGVGHIMAKPFSPRELVQTVECCLAASTGAND